MSSMVQFAMSLTFAALGLCASASRASAQTLTTLVSFDGTDGASPMAGLVRATDGYFYGTTSAGGANSQGTVFRMSPSGALTTLYSFCSQSNCSDGSDPESGLIQASDGNLYGTTAGVGTIFKITLSGTLTTLASIGSYAALVQGSDGNLYGTTTSGGNRCILHGTYGVNCGRVFKMTPTGTVTTLVLLSQTTGFTPKAPLIQASDGNFYGTASKGPGEPGFGTVFKITQSGTLTVLHSFDDTDGSISLGALVQGTDGNFYGTTSRGAGLPEQGGTVFKMTPDGTLTTLHSFTAGGQDGWGPSAALIQATDGNFYGTTAGYDNDQAPFLGTVFKITPSGTLTTLATFVGTDGSLPFSTLVEGTTGLLYGTTAYGANNACSGAGGQGCGTVFSLSAGLN